jgi:lipid A ethanolaminephosphotransferase
MLHGLQNYIDAQSGDILIVLHQMGNHGPAYFKRYPADFERFRPACKSEDLSRCTDTEIGNAYDNAILYTDYFLSEVIALLKSNTPKFETAMLYVSDHGESLGEKGLYLHGMPYMLAPAEQTEVPVLVWASEASDVDLSVAVDRQGQINSHDAVSYSLLALFEIETPPPANAPLLFALKAEDD